MFKKLLSNLPFNPSLIGQLTFYTKRLRNEASVRRFGVAFLVLSLLVQVFAAAVPSESSLARSGNDIIPGGFASQGDAVRHCNNNDYKFKTILNHFGVDCLRIYAGRTRTINSRDYGNQLYSMGRLPYGKPGEVSVSIPNAGRYYMRPLSSWDSGSSSSYTAVTGTRYDGTPFMILYNCGNLVIVGPPTPPPPPPPPPSKVIKCANIVMSVKNKARVPVGTAISLRGQASGKHTGNGEMVNMFYQMVDAKTGKVVGEKTAKGLRFNGSLAQDSQQRVFNLTKPGRYIFKLKVTYNSNGSPKTAQGSNVGSCKKEVVVEKEQLCVDAKPDDDVIVCLELSKKAVNTSQNKDAVKTKAKAGDTIQYSLIVKNTSTNTPVKGFVVEENITDILEYADVVDFHGGSVNDQNVVTWPATDIGTGQTIEKTLTIRVKSQIPDTPASTSNPGSYDCVMTNVYGNAVDIPVACSVAKTTEQITTTLPNTGPGETLAVAFVVTAIGGYFLARTKLMVKELEIVRSDVAISGGN